MATTEPPEKIWKIPGTPPRSADSRSGPEFQNGSRIDPQNDIDGAVITAPSMVLEPFWIHQRRRKSKFHRKKKEVSLTGNAKFKQGQPTTYRKSTEQLNKMIDSKAPIPWIGMYAAAASLICVLALIADIFYSIRHRKLWFPCKYASLNAASLTVLAVAVKLSMDLTTPMPHSEDQAAKWSSTTFFCVSIAYFMPSLGSMSGKDMLLNLTALGILVITLIVNVILQVLTQMINEIMGMEVVYLVIFMIVYTFIMLCFSALTVFTTKRDLEHKYKELHQNISNEEQHGSEIMDFDKLKLRIKKYWVMAETGNPQFVIARSESTAALFGICFLSFVISSPGLDYSSEGCTSSSITYTLVLIGYNSCNYRQTASDYKWSVHYVHWTQYVGMALCVIVSLGRLSVTLLQTIRNIRKCTVSGISLEIKKYRIKRFVEWKKRPPPLQVRGQKLRKIICDIRNLLLNILIGAQIVTVVLNKLLVPISICGFLYLLLFNAPVPIGLIVIIIITFTIFLLCILRMRIRRYFVMLKKKLSRRSQDSVEPNESEDILNNDQELKNFILLLESETIHDGYLMFINTSINSSIRRGAKNQPKWLVELIDQNSTNFEGVLAFESDEVSPILIYKEIPNCWSLPLSTLASIIIALPNFQNEKRNGLLRSLVEGFKYVRLVEKTLDVDEKMASNTIAADSVWFDVEFRHKWLDMDLQKFASESETLRKPLERLASKSKEIVNGFTSTTTANLMEISPINLPDSVIIANSMYKITNTLLLDYADESYGDGQLLEKLTVIIRDVFAACLSNLPHVILEKCSNSAIEEREKSIREATRLLGETQGVMNAIQKLEIPNLSRDQLIYIDEWRALLKRANNAISNSTSSTRLNDVAASSSEVHLDIPELDSSSTSEALGTHEDDPDSHVIMEVEELEEEKEDI